METGSGVGEIGGFCEGCGFEFEAERVRLIDERGREDLLEFWCVLCSSSFVWHFGLLSGDVGC